MLSHFPGTIYLGAKTVLHEYVHLVNQMSGCGILRLVPRMPKGHSNECTGQVTRLIYLHAGDAVHLVL